MSAVFLGLLVGYRRFTVKARGRSGTRIFGMTLKLFGL
jgi:hypothetical protein